MGIARRLSTVAVAGLALAGGVCAAGAADQIEALVGKRIAGIRSLPTARRSRMRRSRVRS